MKNVSPLISFRTGVSSIDFDGLFIPHLQFSHVEWAWKWVPAAALRGAPCSTPVVVVSVLVSPSSGGKNDSVTSCNAVWL